MDYKNYLCKFLKASIGNPRIPDVIRQGFSLDRGSNIA